MTLEQDADHSIQAYEDALGRSAPRTRDMIKRLGYIGTLSKLAISPDLQKGFKALRDTANLDSTFEAVILRHKKQFPQGVIDAAQWRIENADHLQT